MYFENQPIEIFQGFPFFSFYFFIFSLLLNCFSSLWSFLIFSVNVFFSFKILYFHSEPLLSNPSMWKEGRRNENAFFFLLHYRVIIRIAAKTV